MTTATDPASSTYSTYFGVPAYKMDAKTGYPLNAGSGVRRLAVDADKLVGLRVNGKFPKTVGK